jgi:hypothetical protein
MIFEVAIDKEYHPWFAWRPVMLSGPDEWDRQKRTGRNARMVWLRKIWRMRTRPNTYYAMFD